MNFMLVLVLLAVVLFVLGFATKRRFGVLALALFAGSYLAHTWTGQAVPLIEKSGFSLSSYGVSTTAFVGALFTILPAIILLANGPKYGGKWAKVIGSLGFVSLAIILVVPTLNGAFASTTQTDNLVQFVVQNYTILVTVGLVVAIIDLFLSHSVKRDGKKHATEH